VTIVGTDVLLARNEELELASLDTGVTKWKVNLSGSSMAPPVVSGNAAFLVVHPGTITAVSLSDGTPRWKTLPIPGPTTPSFANCPMLLASDGQRLYMTCFDGKLHIVSSSTGMIERTLVLSGNRSRWVSEAVIAPGVLYFCLESTLIAVDLKSQTKLWDYKPDGFHPDPQIAGWGDQLVLTSLVDRELVLLDPRSRASSLIDVGAGILTRAVVLNDSVFVGTETGIVALR
jgi:outer membrane protein assembly factor BamB